MQKKAIFITIPLTLLVVSLVAYFAIRPGRLNIPEPVSDQGVPPRVATTISQVQIEFVLKLAALQEALNQKVPKRFDGVVNDPTDWLSEDTLIWHIDLGSITLSPKDDTLTFSVGFTGRASVDGRFGVKRRNRGPLGWFEELFSESVSETADFAGTVHGTLKPVFNLDWTIDPQLIATVNLNRADAQLFGKAIKVSFRSEVEGKVREKVREFVADLNRKIATDQTIRREMEKGWAALHLVTLVYQSPSVWVSLTPVTVSASSPEVTAEDLILRVAASVRAGVQISERRPDSLNVELPELSPVSEPGSAFSLAIPVTLELKSFHAVPPSQMNLPDSFETAAGKVHVKKLFLLGDAGVLYLGAEIVARTSWLDAVSGTIYLAGKPALDEQGSTLRLEDLKYEIHTSNELLKAADFLLHPSVIAELSKLAVFDIKSSKESLLEIANAEIAKLVAQFPSGIELDFSVKDVGIAELIVDKGWLVAVITADGPAAVRVPSLDGVLGAAVVDVSAAKDTDGVQAGR